METQVFGVGNWVAASHPRFTQGPQRGDAEPQNDDETTYRSFIALRARTQALGTSRFGGVCIPRDCATASAK